MNTFMRFAADGKQQVMPFFSENVKAIKGYDVLNFEFANLSSFGDI